MTSTQETQATLTHHLESFGAKDVDAIVSDFGENSVIYTPDGLVKGLSEIREFFTNLMGIVTPEFLSSMKMLRQDIDGEIAYLLWSAGDIVPLGTDTFIVRDGKIVVQTFAAYMPSG